MLGHKEGKRHTELERVKETGWMVGGAGGGKGVQGCRGWRGGLKMLVKKYIYI